MLTNAKKIMFVNVMMVIVKYAYCLRVYSCTCVFMHVCIRARVYACMRVFHGHDVLR